MDGCPRVLRIGKLTDYATSVMTLLAAEPGALLSASDLAQRSRLELTTVSKLMKLLAAGGLVESRRGANGGYRLARPAEAISVADIVAAMEGPIGVTECSLHDGLCDHESHCGTRGNWRRISEAVEQALRAIRLSDMASGVAPSSRAIPVHLATN
jgi:FeS assembly SUF system regulator